MITRFKQFNETVEVTPNNTAGTAGDTSSTMGYDGFMRSGNDGSFGLQFTPKGREGEVATSYKYGKTKRKIFKKNKKKYDSEIR
jgi:hypothetical protein